MIGCQIYDTSVNSSTVTLVFQGIMIGCQIYDTSVNSSTVTLVFQGIMIITSNLNALETKSGLLFLLKHLRKT